MAIVNTSKGAVSEAPLKKGKKSEAELGKELAIGVNGFKEGEMKEFSIPSKLATSLGNPFYVGVNGVTVGIKVDGRPYKVPKAHAQRMMEIINALD